MKKILLFAIALVSANVMVAQDDCMNFFPDTEGTVLESTTYDVSNNPLRTTTYRINKVSDNTSGNAMEIGFTMANSNGTVINTGNIDASCMDGTFRMKMNSKALTPEVMNILSTNTELVSNFLDYPNIFNNDTYPFESPFTMTDGEFSIKSNNDSRDEIRVRVYNRQYEGNEKITTSARRDSFDAAKVTFSFEVTQDGRTMRYKGKEWYSSGFGIIRSETYDNNDNLLYTTMLTNMMSK